MEITSIIRNLPVGTLMCLEFFNCKGSKATPISETIRFKDMHFNNGKAINQWEINATQIQLRPNRAGELHERVVEMRFYSNNIKKVTVL